MRSVPCERSGPTRLTLSPTFLAITSASWGAIVASEPYSRASKMNDNEDLLIFSCLLLFNREAGVADSANPSPPPPEEVTCCAVTMVTTSVPQPILAIRAQLETKHLCKGVWKGFFFSLISCSLWSHCDIKLWVAGGQVEDVALCELLMILWKWQLNKDTLILL